MIGDIFEAFSSAVPMIIFNVPFFVFGRKHCKVTVLPGYLQSGLVGILMIACQLCKKVPRAVFFLAPRRSEKFNFSTALLRIISFPPSKVSVDLDVLCLQDH